MGVRCERRDDSLVHDQTWDLVSLLASKRALQNKWVWRLKEEDGGKIRYTIRLVVNGFAKKKGIYFNEIFSPIFKMISITTILSLFSIEYLRHEKLDVKTTILRWELEEDIFMEQP